MAEKPKVWDKKRFFPKNLKEATRDYFLYVLDKCLLNGYTQASFVNHPVTFATQISKKIFKQIHNIITY
jgi:hypothetical protein